MKLTKTLSILYLIISIFTIEHICRLKSFIYKPSFILNIIACWLETIFSKIGYYFATISSFLIHLKFHELYISIMAVLEPIVRICLSVFWIFVGYFSEACSYLSNRYMIYIGSLLLIFVMFYICYRIIIYKQKLKHLEHNI